MGNVRRFIYLFVLWTRADLDKKMIVSRIFYYDRFTSNRQMKANKL